jgi:hypothetical protein
LEEDTSCKQKETKCKTGDTLQWEREEEITNLPDMATPSIVRKTYPSRSKHMDLLSMALYYLCRRKKHQNMFDRRRRASTEDQPHYPVVKVIEAAWF